MSRMKRGKIVLLIVVWCLGTIVAQPSLIPYTPDPTNDFTPTLEWSSVSGATDYRIQIDDEAGFSSLIYDGYTSGATNYTHGDSLPEDTIYWHVSSDTGLSPYTDYSVTDNFVITGAPIITPYAPDPTPDKSPTFTWNAVSGAADYFIQVDDNVPFATPYIGEYTTSGPAPSYTVSGPTLSTDTYYWRVSSSNDYNKYFSYDEFTVQQLIFNPFPEDTTIDQTPEVSWVPFPGASAYKVEFASNKNFSPTAHTNIISFATTYESTPLSQGTTYWRFSCDLDGYTNYSDIDSFVIDINQYPEPIPFSPQTVSTLQPLFQWNPVSGASTYTLQVDNESSFSVPLEIDITIGGTSYNDPSPMTQGTFYWKVSSTLKPNSFCPYETVTINTAPNINTYAPDPTPSSMPTFTWNAVSGAAGYNIEIADNITFNTPMTDYISGATSYPASLPYEGPWYWQVSSDIDASHFSSTDAFSYQKPQINRWEGIAIHENVPTFNWSSYPGANDYYIQIDDEVTFATPLYTYYTSGATSYSSAGLSTATSYYWRVSTNLDYSAYSNIDSVRVTSSPDLAPFSFDTTTDLRVTFKWRPVSGATQYRIQVDDDIDFLSTLFTLNTYAYDDTSFNYYNFCSEDLPLGKLYWRVSNNYVNINDFSDPDSLVLIDTTSCWYVSTTGNENNAGTAASPFDSISTALNHVSPGDTIKVSEGTYLLGEYVYINDSCITLLGGYSTDFSVRNYESYITAIDAQNSYYLSITDRDSILIDGFTFKNSTSEAILISWSDHIIISNNVFVNCYTGIKMEGGSHIKIENNVFTLGVVAILDSSNCHNIKVVNNTFAKNGIGIEFANYSDTAVVFNNIFALNRKAVFKNSGAYMSNDSVAYNSFYGNDSDYVDSLGVLKTGLAVNTIFHSGNNLVVNPLFMDTATGSWNFHLSLGSQCVDAGDPDFPYANEPAPNGSRINLGAYGNTPWATISGTSPSFSINLVADTAEVGASQLFDVAVAGSLPFTYQWYTDTGVIAGASGSAMVVSTINQSDSARYWVVVSNAYGTITSDTAYLFVPTPITITAQPTDSTVLLYTPVSLTVAAAGEIPIQYFWVKNDADTVGSISSYSLTSTTVPDAALYYCIVYNQYDTLKSDTARIRVEKSPAANFSGSPLIGIDTLTVIFSDASSGDIDRWIWNYGDGDIDTFTAQTNMSHYYDTPGTYTVSLTTQNLTFNLDSTLTKTDYITVHQKSASSFTGIPRIGIDSVTVAFTLDSISSGVSKWVWTYGDGEIDSFTVATNPTHIYSNPGMYDVKLKVSGNGGIDSTVRPSYISVYTKVVAAFTASDTIGEVPLTVTFNDSSTGDIDTWHWEFGDGNTGSVQTPVHVYEARGVFDVKLVVSGNGGTDSLIKSSYITVINSPPVLTLQAVDTVKEDSLWQMAATVTDANNDAVELSFISGAPSDMVINQSTYIFTWTPDNDDIGEYPISVLADDGYGGTDTASFTLSVLNTNDFPVIDSIVFPDTAYEDSLMIAKVVVSDPDNFDSVGLSLSSNVSWLSITRQPLTRGGNWLFDIQGTPGDADTGLFQITATVTDRDSLSTDTVQFVYVINTNDPPDTKLSKKDILYGAVQYAISAADDFDSVFTFTTQFNGGGVRYDTIVSNTSGTFSFYPLVDGKYIFSCKATDQDGLEDPTPYVDTLVIAGASAHTWSDTGIWDMLSVPGASYSAAAIKTAGKVLHWDESQEPNGIYKYYIRSSGITDLTAGNAYWIKLDTTAMVSLTQNELSTGDSLVIKLSKAEYGWNQIASPYPYPVKWNSTLTLWEWDATNRDFVESDGVLYPWDGYWVLAESATPVTVNADPLYVSKSHARRSRILFIDKTEWTFKITLKSNINHDADNLFGISKYARNGYDALDRPEPPRMGDEPYLFFAHPEWKRSVNQFASDIRRTWDSKVNIFQVGISPCAKDVTALMFTIAGYDQETPIYLFVNTLPEMKQYKPGTAVTIKPSNAVQYRTVFATTDKDFLNKFPYKFALNHPYPNPCRQRATIKYTLPYRWESNGWLDTKPYKVKMVIYDARGRVIRELVNRKQGPGHYRIIWRGKSNTGHMVASGFYFVRIVAGKYSSVKKIIALR